MLITIDNEKPPNLRKIHSPLIHSNRSKNESRQKEIMKDQMEIQNDENN